MSWRDWLFWRKHCKLCSETYKGKGAILWLTHNGGKSKINICSVCSGVLEANRQNILSSKLQTDDIMKLGEDDKTN